MGGGQEKAKTSFSERLGEVWQSRHLLWGRGVFWFVCFEIYIHIYKDSIFTYIKSSFIIGVRGSRGRRGWWKHLGGMCSSPSRFRGWTSPKNDTPENRQSEVRACT